ncbi:Rpn family recombination-promoting nuclease/putative transposase [Stieleria mannarensis]|uniref:Rpn family recombination-promoting nuclease/putative transposase n=1 Tax=Stieleria mannarensis TaxID=2755585 RepID=UPI0016009A9A|nr:Rpn family recombination-promoting nuclease/putative transposase [Rhodopirellula sp. JC639]
MPLGIRPTVDFVFKLLFGSLENTDLLIHLLNAVLQSVYPIEEVEILNPYNDKMFEDDKLSIVDVKARDSAGAWYVIEVQTTIPGELRNRLVFYTAELFSRQMNEGTTYGELRPAISICFMTEPLFKEVKFGHLRFALHDAAHSLTFGDQIQLHLIQLSKYHVDVADLADADAFERWVYFLTESQNRDPDELRQLLPDAAFCKATEILEMIAKSPELRLIYDDRAKEAKDRFSELEDAKTQGKLIGQIQFAQRMLGKNVAADSELGSCEISNLRRILADLESQFPNRG